MGSSLYVNQETKNTMESCQTFTTNFTPRFREWGASKIFLTALPSYFLVLSFFHIFKLHLLQ
jgi:hypothetical protein